MSNTENLLASLQEEAEEQQAGQNVFNLHPGVEFGFEIMVTGHRAERGAIKKNLILNFRNPDLTIETRDSVTLNFNSIRIENDLRRLLTNNNAPIPPNITMTQIKLSLMSMIPEAAAPAHAADGAIDPNGVIYPPNIIFARTEEKENIIVLPGTPEHPSRRYLSLNSKNSLNIFWRMVRTLRNNIIITTPLREAYFDDIEVRCHDSLIQNLVKCSEIFHSIDRNGEKFTLVGTTGNIYLINKNGVTIIENGYQDIYFYTEGELNIPDFEYDDSIDSYYWANYLSTTIRTPLYLAKILSKNKEREIEDENEVQYIKQVNYLESAWLLQNFVIPSIAPYFMILNIGETGSGKTFTMEKISMLLYGTRIMVKKIDKERVRDLLMATINNNYLVLDEAEEYFGKYGKEFCTICQHGYMSERTLHINGKEFVALHRSTLGFTMVNIRSSVYRDQGLRDRIILNSFGLTIPPNEKIVASDDYFVFKQKRNTFWSSLFNFLIKYFSADSDVPENIDRMGDVQRMFINMKRCGINVDLDFENFKKDIILLSMDYFYHSLIMFLDKMSSMIAQKIIQPDEWFTSRDLCNYMKLDSNSDIHNLSIWLSKNSNILEQYGVCHINKRINNTTHLYNYQFVDINIKNSPITVKESDMDKNTNKLIMEKLLTDLNVEIKDPKVVNKTMQIVSKYVKILNMGVKE